MIHFLDLDSDFPDAHLTDDHGMLAVGGDLSTQRLLTAYRSGIFPWYNDGEPICWWSPDPRMVFDLRSDTPLKLSKSLKQSRRNKGYEIRKNTCFKKVITQCAQASRNGEIGTWIHDDLITAYTQLHHLGHAQSIEVFKNDVLVGGLYGIDLPDLGIFCGESMFSTATDASKIALWHLVEELKSKNYRIIDAQVYNDHLASLGAVELDREVFLSLLNP